MSQYIFLSAVFSVVYAVLILVVGLSTAFLVSRTVKSELPWLADKLITEWIADFNRNDHGVSRKLTKIALTSCVLYTGVILWTIINSVDSYFPFLPKEILLYRMDILMFSSDMVSIPYHSLSLIISDHSNPSLHPSDVRFQHPEGHQEGLLERRIFWNQSDLRLHYFSSPTKLISLSILLSLPLVINKTWLAKNTNKTCIIPSCQTLIMPTPFRAPRPHSPCRPLT